MRPEGWHLVIVIVLAIVLFGAPRLPGMARSVGQSLRIFRSEVKQMKEENNTADTGVDPVTGWVVGHSGPPVDLPPHEAAAGPPGHRPHQ